MAKTEVKAPPELVKAAEVALDEKMKPRYASDLLKYLIIRGAIERHGGNRAKAAKSLGISSSSMNVAETLLQVRLS